MLRDLDQRQKHPQSNAAPAAIAPMPRRTLIMVVWLVIAVVLAGLVFYFSWQQTDQEPAPVTQQRESNQPVNAEQLAPVAAEAKPQKAEPTSENDSSEAVLAADSSPQNSGNQTSDNQSSGNQSSSGQPAATTASQTQAATESEDPDTARPAPEQSATKTPNEQPASSGSAEATDTSEPSMSVRRVQLSPAQLAARNLEKAEEAFSKGQQQQGQELLEQALTVQPLNTVVRERLAAYWYGRGYGNRALAILQQGIQLEPQAADLKLLLARMYQRLDMSADALEVLKSMTLRAERAREGLSIRAELAWKAADYEQAVADYQALTQAQPGNARWWLGLALALDDSDVAAAAAAADAYRQALQIGGFTAATNLYIQDRLAQLQDSQAGGD